MLIYPEKKVEPFVTVTMGFLLLFQGVHMTRNEAVPCWSGKVSVSTVF